MSNPAKSTSKKRIAFGVAVVLVVLGGLAAVLISVYSGESLPDSSEIRQMSVNLNNRVTGKRLAFEIPKSHWENVLDALGPGKHAFFHAKWIAGGTLKLTTTSSETVIVSLYKIEGGRGGFSVKTENSDETFYLGGDSEPLQDALRQAYQESR